MEEKEIQRKEKELSGTVKLPAEAESYKLEALASGKRSVMLHGLRQRVGGGGGGTVRHRSGDRSEPEPGTGTGQGQIQPAVRARTRAGTRVRAGVRAGAGVIAGAAVTLSCPRLASNYQCNLLGV